MSRLFFKSKATKKLRKDSMAFSWSINPPALWQKTSLQLLMKEIRVGSFSKHKGCKKKLMEDSAAFSWSQRAQQKLFIAAAKRREQRKKNSKRCKVNCAVSLTARPRETQDCRSWSRDRDRTSRFSRRFSAVPNSRSPPLLRTIETS